MSDGQKLQVIESVGGEADATRDRRIERIPDEIVQFHREARRPSIAWPRDLDMLAGLKHDAAEHPADRLREARSGILSRRICIGISAVPWRRAAQLVGGKPVDRPGRKRTRQDHECEDQETVI